jgi:hypothetical protein
MTEYRHYKGGVYELVCTAILESDPEVQMVVYKAANGTIWTRPSNIFFELVEFQGQQIPRFSLIE